MVTQLSTPDDKKRTAAMNSTMLDSLSLNLSQMEKMAAIGQLSSSVSHEMRNLLGIIRTATFNIDRALKTKDATIQNNVDVINRSIKRAREFIDNLLNLARMPHGKDDEIDICEEVDNLLTLFSKELELRGIKLERHYQALPLFWIDCHALQECLMNLVLNAIQSLDRGGTIAVSIESWKQGIRIAVRDTGCGVPARDLEKIFDQFYTTKKNGQGTGLGLTIARNLARNLGGDIEVESHLDKGSIFTVCLPVLTAVPGRCSKEKSHSYSWDRKTG